MLINQIIAKIKAVMIDFVLTTLVVIISITFFVTKVEIDITHTHKENIIKG